MKMNLDDPALTAFALGELNPEETAAAAAMVSADDQLAQESAAISSLGGLLSETLGGEEFSLGEERREEIFQSGRRPDADVLVLENRKRSRRQSMIAVVGVAAVVAAGFVGLSKMGADPRKIAGAGGESAGTGSGVPSEESSTGVDSVKSMVGKMNPDQPSMVVPLTIEAADPSLVEKSLALTGKLPGREEFVVENWVNLTPMSSEADLTIGNADVRAELGGCSWNSENALLMVSFQPVEGKTATVSASLSFDPARVKSARYLGASELEGAGSGESGRLSKRQTLLYELTLLEGSGGVGSVNLQSDEGEGYLPLAEGMSEEPSVDFAVAQLLAGFAKWGGSEGREGAELDDLAHEARGLLSVVTDEKARYALDMILLSEESLEK